MLERSTFPALTNKRIAVVLNSAAGTRFGRSSAERQRYITALLEKVGLEAQIHWTKPAHLTETLQQIIAGGVETLIIGGGDGTLSSAANLLVDTTITLGVLPLGTFNHFARDLGIPLDLPEAIRLLAMGRTKTVDVCEVNGRIFINNASIGIYPYAVRRRDIYQQQLGLPKRIAMFYALLGALWKLPSYKSRVRLNDTEWQIKSPFLFLGNNRYQAISPGIIARRSLAENAMCVLYAHQPGHLALLKIALQILFKSLDNVAELKTLLTRAAVVEISRKTLKLALDGEVIAIATPLHFRLHAAALRVIAPASRTPL